MIQLSTRKSLRIATAKKKLEYKHKGRNVYTNYNIRVWGM